MPFTWPIAAPVSDARVRGNCCRRQRAKSMPSCSISQPDSNSRIRTSLSRFVDMLIRADGAAAATLGSGLGAGLGLSPSIPVRSNRLQFGFPGGRVTFVLGMFGGGARAKVKWEMSANTTRAKR